MALQDKTLKLCDCNGSAPLDAQALARALKLGAPPTVHRALCRKELGAFRAALGESELLVGCTQEAPLFTEVAEQAGSQAAFPIKLRFFNLREAAGWSAEGGKAAPKMAALIAAAALPEPEPVPVVEYQSGGRILVIGPSAAALDWAGRLPDTLAPTVLITRQEGGALPAVRAYAVYTGAQAAVSGQLGAFEVSWRQDNAIDLEVCTRCNACVEACPEQAIDASYQVDAARCTAHRACVKACGDIGAIDFSRADRERGDRFDLVLDLSAQPLLRMPDLPQGYAAPGADPLAQALAVLQLSRLVGEFEKPKFFEYKAKLCAHSRSGRPGCSRCLDVCSTGAIRADGDGVAVEPQRCAGCGGCATVCPTGAMRYAYPGMPDTGARLKTMLAAYREAGGANAGLLIHDAGHGRSVLSELGRRAAQGAARGLPARVIPMEAHHVASVGIDTLLAAICYGAAQVLVVAKGDEPDAYLAAIEEQMSIARTVLRGWGYADTHVQSHFKIIRAEDPAALEAALWSLPEARTVAQPAAFNLSSEKRTTLDFAIEHLAKHAPAPVREIALPRGAPFGSLAIDPKACTLCKSCIGACPASALLDTPEAPVLRFIERNCVQCGLCVNTCPEKAITLVPRLLTGAAAKEPVKLMEAEPFHCVRCGKPFGTRQLVEVMMGKLGAHAMFAGGAGLRRLQMCGECRVVDMMDNKNEVSIHDVKGGG